MKDSNTFVELYPKFGNDSRLTKDELGAIALIYDLTDGLKDFDANLFAEPTLKFEYELALKAMFRLSGIEEKPKENAQKTKAKEAKSEGKNAGAKPKMEKNPKVEPKISHAIKLEVDTNTVKITSYYNEAFVTKARGLRGKWVSGKWVFAIDMLENVRKAMLDCYGVTGEQPYKVCTLIYYDLNTSEPQGGIELFGRPIAKAFGRDSGAKLSDGIYLVKGAIYSSGSVKNWTTTAKEATIEIKEFPIAALRRDDVQKAISANKVVVKDYVMPSEKDKNSKPKKEVPKDEFKGKFVRKESEEHKFVRRFLGIRKHPEMNLIVNAYKELNKSVIDGTLKKEGARHPQLIYAMQQAYYNVIIRKANSLELTKELLEEAENIFNGEKRYETVKYLTEYTGWTGKEKTEKQVELFLKKIENALKDAQKSDPYYDELSMVKATLSKASAGQVIMPQSVGLSGIPKGFKIVK